MGAGCHTGWEGAGVPGVPGGGPGEGESSAGAAESARRVGSRAPKRRGSCRGRGKPCETCIKPCRGLPQATLCVCACRHPPPCPEPLMDSWSRFAMMQPPLALAFVFTHTFCTGPTLLASLATVRLSVVHASYVRPHWAHARPRYVGLDSSLRSCRAVPCLPGCVGVT